MTMYSLRAFGVILLITFIFVIPPRICKAQTVSETTAGNIDQEKTVRSNLYVGAKVGLVYVLGIEMNYILQTHEVDRLYLAAAIQSSFIVNSANVGGGFFLGRTGVGVGCRYHHLLWFESEKESKIQPGYGPELIYNKTIGTKYMINLHAGAIITEGSLFPDISFGVFIPLN
jgi:hypothetical protein